MPVLYLAISATLKWMKPSVLFPSPPTTVCLNYCSTPTVHIDEVHMWKNWHNLIKQERWQPQQWHLGAQCSNTQYLSWMQIGKIFEWCHLIVSTLYFLNILVVSALLKNQTTHTSDSVGTVFTNTIFWNSVWGFHISKIHTFENSVARTSQRCPPKIKMD